MKMKLQVDLMGNSDWFLRMKFDWSITDSMGGQGRYHTSQESYANEVVGLTGVSTASMSSCDSSLFRSPC